LGSSATCKFCFPYPVTLPIIHFSHANGFPALCYRRLFGFLESDFRIGYVDRIGHDPSFPVTDGWAHLVDELTAAIDARWNQPVVGVGHSLGGYLTAMAAVRRPEFWVVFVEFWGEMLHDRRLRDLNTAVYTRTRRLLGRLIAEGVRTGHFRAVDPARAAAVVLGLIDGLSLQLTFDPEAFTVAEATRFCGDALDRYLGREASS
jgi:pimeloyl-ACP methyl ester carboxylesterase